MSEFIEELFLKLACETPLPRSSAAICKTGNPSPTKPYTRAQAKAEQQTDPLPSLPTQPWVFSKKRGRKPDFDILVDADAASSSPYPPPKKLKSKARTPLSIRKDFANDSQGVTSHKPDTPFPFSRSDPLWDNVENYDPRLYYMTPPSTPGGPSPVPSPSSFSSPRRTTRTTRPRQIPAASPLPPPQDQTLYRALALDNWKATDTQIKNAYKKVALEYHPDKVAESQRETATHMMQTVNAAREVLLDHKRRRAYHISGKLP